MKLSNDDFGVWLKRIGDGKKWLEELRENTKMFRDAFHGEFDKPYPEEDAAAQVYVNRVHRVVLQWIGSMYAQNPRIHLEPPTWTRDEGHRRKVALQESILNTEIRRAGMEQPVRKTVQSALLDGWGWVKTGFHVAEDGELEEEEATTNAVDENAMFDYANERPGDLPKKVLLHEDHVEHIDLHREKEKELDEAMKAIEEQAAQKATMLEEQMAEQFGNVMGIPPELQLQADQQQAQIDSSLEGMRAVLKALRSHIKKHVARLKERDEGGERQTNTRVRVEGTWVDYVHNSNVVWDWHATGPHDWRWVAERFIKPVGEFQDDTRFKKRHEITANYTHPKPGTRGSAEDGGDECGGAVRTLSEDLPDVDFDADPDQLAAVWKIWDVEFGRIIYLHEGMDEPLLVEEWPHRFLGTAPLRMLYFELREDEFIPVSPLTHIWDQQLELNRYRTKAGLIARRLNIAMLVDASVNDEFVTDVMDGKDVACHKTPVHGMNKRISDLFELVDFGQVPPDIHVLSQIAQNDIEMDSGLGEPQLTGTTKAKTATAAQIGKAASTVSLDLKLSSIEEFVRQVASDLRGLMRQYYKKERYVEVYWEGSKDMEAWKGSDLEDFDIRVELGSSRREEKEIERMQMLTLLEKFAPIAQPLGIDLRFIARRVLEAHGIRNPEEAFIDQATQQAQQGMIPPGQGQGQQALPGNMPGSGGGAVGQPAMDMTK
ncbi:MAG: hypothetical protein GY820_39535 [Gammaproteobacteria bacterium]|nr:hypothetical protein [Gammaproteobacteria bacterium]